MSQENVEIVRSMYEAYLRGDAERALADIHPDVEADFSVRVDTGVVRGREALAKIVGSWVGTWDGYEEEVEEILDLGDSVCIVARQRGRGKGSGAEVENRFASLYELEDGVIIRITMYDDVTRALEAAAPDG